MFIGTFYIVSKVSEVSIKLNLPDTYRIHPVLRVSYLCGFVPPSSIDFYALLAPRFSEGE